jgi:CPA1 family monovalent cation:H+ antiporter
MSQAGPRVGRADTRQQTIAFWSLATFLLNGALFVLVGLEVQAAVRGLTSVAVVTALVAVVVSAVVIGVRFAWLFTIAYVVRLLDRRPQQARRRVGAASVWSAGLPTSGVRCRSLRRSPCRVAAAAGGAARPPAP